MKKILQWIVPLTGYGMYALALTAALLWVLFPAESFRAWLETRLNSPESPVTWEIKEMRVAWPFSVAALDIKATGRENGDAVLLVNELKIEPDILRLRELKDKWPLAYTARILDGTVRGKALADKKDGQLHISGTMSGLQIGGLESVWRQLGRQGSGKLSGEFNYEGKWQSLLSGTLRSDMEVTGGSLELRQQLFGLENLEFSRLSAIVTLKERTVSITEGKVKSNLLGADFSGNLSLAGSLLNSGINLEGDFEPRPELLGGLNDPAMIELIKGRLKDNKLKFTISDTIQDPGMVIDGLSGAMDGMIQGRDR